MHSSVLAGDRDETDPKCPNIQRTWSEKMLSMSFVFRAVLTLSPAPGLQLETFNLVSGFGT